MSSPLEPPDGPSALGLLLVPERSTVRIGEREVIVTRTQFRLLSVLVAEPNRTVSRAELVEQGIGDLVSERTVDVDIKELRRKLGPEGWQSVPGAREEPSRQPSPRGAASAVESARRAGDDLSLPGRAHGLGGQPCRCGDFSLHDHSAVSFAG